ncbi:MAG: DUF2807 domain-containing protein [Chlamydiales bacterium]|nr:DUF2807 domain-containing protein [Chlamydiales bacterium]
MGEFYFSNIVRGNVHVSNHCGTSTISNIGNSDIVSIGNAYIGPDPDWFLFRPIYWCGRQWKDWARSPQLENNCLRASIQKIALFVPLAFATLAASLIGIVGLVTGFRIIDDRKTWTSNSGVGSSTIVGSNNFIKQTFNLGSNPIPSIHLSFGPLLIESGETNSLEVEIEDNLSKHFAPSLQNGELTLGRMSSSNTSVCSHGIQYKLTLTQSPSKLNIAGSGDVEIRELKTAGFRCDISGSGRVVIQAGALESQVVKISGSGKYLASNLKSKDCTVRISGSGIADVQANSTLSVAIPGSGECIYSGNPEVSSSIKGSGYVKKK